MSLNAYIWAASLPIDACAATAYRVLLKYADKADQFGRTAWRENQFMAEELGCSVRTIQRGVRELLEAGLIFPGDQRYVEHIRPDRRPVVYDLAMLPQQQPELPGIESDGVTDGVTPYGVTNLSRGDNSCRRGVTTGVAHRTVLEPNRDISTVGNGRGDRTVTPWNGVAPAPKLPKLSDIPDAPRQPRQPAEQLALNEQAAQLTCPAYGARFTHLVPATETACARCGVEAADILAEVPA